MSQVKTFGMNEVIFKQGDYAQCMYEIQSGSVNIYADFGKEDEKLLTTLEAGQFFGEIGIVEALLRTATAIAAQDNTILSEITPDNVSVYFQNKPEKLLEIMRHMSERLRELTQEYLEARATIAEAIDNAKNGKKQSGILKEKIAKLVQNLINPAFLKNNTVYEEAAFLNAQANVQRIVKTFSKNEVIFREGDAANCLYDIHWGKVGIFANYGTDNESLLT
jgi:CRP-like cAMP-binding protein